VKLLEKLHILASECSTLVKLKLSQYMNGYLIHYVLTRSWEKSCIIPMVD